MTLSLLLVTVRILTTHVSAQSTYQHFIVAYLFLLPLFSSLPTLILPLLNIPSLLFLPLLHQTLIARRLISHFNRIALSLWAEAKTALDSTV
jgi:hypothetical protein